MPGGSSGFELEEWSDERGPDADDFSVTGTTPPDSGTGVGIAGTNPLVQRSAGGDDGSAFGKSIP
jgi:hypothetical protein